MHQRHIRIQRRVIALKIALHLDFILHRKSTHVQTHVKAWCLYRENMHIQLGYTYECDYLRVNFASRKDIYKETCK